MRSVSFDGQHNLSVSAVPLVNSIAFLLIWCTGNLTRNAKILEAGVVVATTTVPVPLNSTALADFIFEAHVLKTSHRGIHATLSATQRLCFFEPLREAVRFSVKFSYSIQVKICLEKCLACRKKSLPKPVEIPTTIETHKPLEFV
jgi:hypothetical protein